MRRMILAASILATATLFACSHNEKGIEISEISYQSDHTIVYLKIDPSKADLPWTIMMDRTNLLTKDGTKKQAAGIAVKGPLAAALQGVTISSSNDQNILKFEIISGGMIQLVAPLDRAPRPGELALAFATSMDQVTGIELVTKAGKTITLTAEGKKR